jgi:hypothetical protein
MATMAVAAVAVVVRGAESARTTPALTVAGQALQIDGRVAFLPGISLFDALGPTPPRDQDLDAIKSWGVKIVRVWSHWNVPIYEADGTLTASGDRRLIQLVQRLQSRGLILELVLLRPGQLPGQPFAVFASESARLRSVESITIALREYGNVLFDLFNEHDHGDGPITHVALRILRDKVKALDPDRLVTVSSTEYHLIGGDGRVGEHQARNLREEAGTDAGAVGVDVVAMHFPRTKDWAASTAGRVQALRSSLDLIDRRLPIYLSEENRASGDVRLPADEYRRAIAGAREAGAAGWVFHTDAGFELRKQPFLNALNPEERIALSRLQQP